ncbi:MAG: hypothetical protein ACR2QA_01625 [Solirubrobacteraceae bacterium]
MRVAKACSGLAAGLLVGAAPPGLAADVVTPGSGQFRARLAYMAGTKPEHAVLRITLSANRISTVHLNTSFLLPYDSKLSHGVGCNERIEKIYTDGDKDAGGVRRDGSFSYTFSSNSPVFSDRVIIAGRFTDAKHAAGTYRDLYTLKGRTFASRCDTGQLKFSASHD